jgi:oxygen-dependent protoporphyrinogen oxidase
MNMEKYDIIIIGAGLTGLTSAYYLKKAGLNIKILEKDSRTGGVINTSSENGFIYEHGPNSGIINTVETVELLEEFKNDCKLEIANNNSKARWILKDKKWEPLPNGLVSAINTPLFKFKDKISILGEMFRKKGENPDETVSELVIRRLGKSFLDYAIDPFISGIYAGDPKRLVTKYALPKLYNLEQEYGSFIKGAIKKGRQPKTELQKKVTKEVFSIEFGLVNFINAISNKIGYNNIELNCENLQIKTNEKPYIVEFERDGKKYNYSADRIITTSGGYTLKNMLVDIDNNLLEPIDNLNYAKVAQVVLGYKKWNGIELKAFGGLIPEIENRNILGILFLSSLFKHRAPEPGALLSIFIGGIKRPELSELSDEKLTQLALTEIEELMQIKNSSPDLIKILRYKHAIPQYEKSSKERYEKIEEIQAKFPGLILAGNIRDGIGMGDRIAQGRKIAETIIQNFK